MFCFQCEQTAGGEGCTTKGVCGKDPDTAALQDLLVYAAKGIAQYAHRARKLGASDREIDVFVIEALFTTVTNVNFDPDRVAQLIRRAAKIRDKAKDLYEGAAAAAGQRPQQLEGPAAVDLSGNLDALIAQGVEQTIQLRFSALGPDVTGLQELITYGLKGSAAYADHALVLGAEKDEIYAGFHEVLDYLAEDPADVGELTATALKVGDLNLKVMELLDKANTGTYGHPEPTAVSKTLREGPAIIVS
ncbi:MAG: hydroxylamine reductase, partial [Candidatus Hydrogenedentes bacterium]|nr:hydroxylamine reductase [Candidatus Hydrogenedentota bacterium]